MGQETSELQRGVAALTHAAQEVARELLFQEVMVPPDISDGSKPLYALALGSGAGSGGDWPIRSGTPLVKRT